MPTGSDPTRIAKTPITPRKAFKPGTSAATWESIKYQTSKSFNQNGSVINNSVRTSYNHQYAAENGHGNGFNSKFKQVIKIGDNGEIFISFGNILEVWDWSRSALEVHMDDDEVDENEEDTNVLYLVASLTDLLISDEIVDFTIIDINHLSNTYKVLLTLKRDNEIFFLIKSIGQIEEDYEEEENDDEGNYHKKINNNQFIILPPSIHGSEPFKIQSSKKFIGISTNEGSLTVFDQDKSQLLSLNLNVKVLNDDYLFDIQGRYLVYVPDDSDGNANNQNERDLIYTKLNIPLNNRSIYSKLLENLSNSTIDGISKLSANIQDKKFKKNLKNYLTNLINGENNDLSKNTKIILIDLETEKQLACFKPPSDGISNLSLSPFNSHLITINSRGNQIYKWDLTKIPNIIDLVDIQTRGKTSSIVNKINWYSNNIFQILTLRSGSIHCFFTNLNLRNWILPNLKIDEIGRIRNIKNNNDGDIIAKIKDSNAIYRIDLDGNYNSKYELPLQPIQKTLLPDYIPVKPTTKIIFKPEDQETMKIKNSLSQVEIESCLVGDLLINNKRFEYATYTLQDEELNNKNSHEEDPDEDQELEEDQENEQDEEEYYSNEIKNSKDHEKFWKLYNTFGNDLKLGKHFKKVNNKFGMNNNEHGGVKFEDENAQLTDLIEAMKGN